jgi:hypothetical protein
MVFARSTQLSWADVEEIVVNWGPPAPGARVFENYGIGEAKNILARLIMSGSVTWARRRLPPSTADLPRVGRGR